MNHLHETKLVIPAEFQPQLAHPPTNVAVNAGVAVPATVTLEVMEQHVSILKIGQHSLTQLIELGIGARPFIAQIIGGATVISMQGLLGAMGELAEMVTSGRATNEEKIKAAKVMGELSCDIRDMNTAIESREPKKPISIAINNLNQAAPAAPQPNTFAVGEILQPQ